MSRPQITDTAPTDTDPSASHSTLSRPGSPHTPTEADFTPSTLTQEDEVALQDHISAYDSARWQNEAEWYKEEVRRVGVHAKETGKISITRMEIEDMVKAKFAEEFGRAPDLRSKRWRPI